MNDETTILIVADDNNDADNVSDIVKTEFDHVELSLDPERFVDDFIEYKPTVVILAFSSVEGAKTYYLGLYKMVGDIYNIPHQTLVLCKKEELDEVYQLCKKEYFSSYMLYWPLGYDSTRLHMEIWHAIRRCKEIDDTKHSVGNFALEARKIGDLGTEITRSLDQGVSNITDIKGTVKAAESEIENVLNELMHQLPQQGEEAMLSVDDLKSKIENIKHEVLNSTLQNVNKRINPLDNWVESVKASTSKGVEAMSNLKSLGCDIKPILLVVDDDAIQRKLLGKILDPMDVDVHFAVSGFEALGMLSKVKPNLIFMDINMPELNGIETTKKITSSQFGEGVTVIMLTGNGHKQAVIDSHRAGASDFLVKPYNKEVIQEKIKKYLYV